jgi:hypothetical protein
MLQRALVPRSPALLAEGSCVRCRAAGLRPLQLVRHKVKVKTKDKSEHSYWNRSPANRDKFDRKHRFPYSKSPEELVAQQLDPLAAYKMDKAQAKTKPINTDVLAAAHRAKFLKMSASQATQFMRSFWELGPRPSVEQLQDTCARKQQPLQCI